MAVDQVKEYFAGRRGSNRAGVRDYDRVFRVRTTSKNDGPYTAGSAALLPKIGSTHNEDLYAWCNSLEVRQLPKTSTYWMITAKYSSKFEMKENPLLEPARISWKTEKYQRVVVFDRDGDAVTNSAGQWYSNPPPTADASRFIISFQKNLYAVPSWILTYNDSVNQAAFNVQGLQVGVEKAKMGNVAISERQRRNSVDFYAVSFDLHLNPDTWDLKLLDQGLMRKGDTGAGEDANKRYSIALDGDATAPPEKVFLDGSGRVLSNPTPATAVFNTFEIYNLKDFGVLPLT